MSLRVIYLKREQLRDSEFLLGVELVLSVGMMWDMLLHRQLHGEPKAETPRCSDETKGDEPVSLCGALLLALL